MCRRVCGSRSGEGLEGDGRKGIGHPGQGLDVAGDEMPNILVFRQVAFYQQVELPRGRIHFGNMVDVEGRFVGDLIRLAEVTFHLNEDRLHIRT